jgi:hypothetical protein
MAKLTNKKIDARVNSAYSKNCSGIQVNIMDLSKVMAVGKASVLAGDDDDATLGTKLRSYALSIAK